MIPTELIGWGAAAVAALLALFGWRNRAVRKALERAERDARLARLKAKAEAVEKRDEVAGLSDPDLADRAARWVRDHD